MFSIPNIPTEFKVTINGKIAKFYRALIKEVINATLYKERIQNKKIQIEVVICDIPKITKYNNEYLKKEGPTDIISICYEKYIPSDRPTTLGSILICPKIITERAQDLKKDYTQHLTHLLVHGTLHLLGYNHEEDTERLKMENKEINILSFLGITSPYN